MSLPTHITTTNNNNENNSNNEVEFQTSNDELPRWRQALRDFSNRANNICFVITYPFMVVLTVVGLFVVIAFCIFPTLLLAIMVVCIYYCLTEDPIPLSVLLRYLLSVDEDEHGHPDHYTMAQNRPVVQKKLIIRKVLDVQDKTEDTPPNEETPRSHPFPITVVTEKKVLKYSEPLIFKDEESNGNEGVDVPPPVSHAFRPAPLPLPPPPVADDHDEETGIQLTVQRPSSPQSPTRIEEVDSGDQYHSKGEEEKSYIEESVLDLPSGSDGDDVIDDDDDDGDSDDLDDDHDGDNDSEVHSTNSIHEHHDKMDPLFIAEDGAAKNDGGGNSSDDDETDDSGKLSATGTMPLQDAPITVGSQDDEEDENDDSGISEDSDQEEQEDEGYPDLPHNPSPVTTGLEPVLEADPEEDEEEEVREVIHDDYFGINEQQDRGTTCDICLLEFEADDLVAWSPNTECSHCFHKDCILDWLVRKHSCPSCRKDYLKGAKDDTTNSSPTNAGTSSPTWSLHRQSSSPPPAPMNHNFASNTNNDTTTS